MSLKKYLSDKLIYLIFHLLGLGFLFYVLSVFVENSYVRILTISFFVFGNVLYLIFDYFKRRNYYSRIFQNLDQMDKKHLIVNLLESPDFSDAEILDEILRVTTKSMNDELAQYKREVTDYQDYIESWIHEVKTPISCIDLICRNSKNKISSKISVENKKIEEYVEQILFYAKSMNVSDDYRIRKMNLNDVVKGTLKNFSKQLILVNAQIQMSIGDISVYCDEKWLAFILGQIISNSIKYRKDKLVLEFTAFEKNNSVVLSVKDNGIGISQKDLSKVFNRGFTGENGRILAKSTGMGLYICKTLCDKLFLDLKISSKKEMGTEVTITFPLDKREFEV